MAGGPRTAWEHSNFQDFKQRIGIATVPGLDAKDGVRLSPALTLDFEVLPAITR